MFKSFHRRLPSQPCHSERNFVTGEAAERNGAEGPYNVRHRRRCFDAFYRHTQTTTIVASTTPNATSSSNVGLAMSTLPIFPR